MQDLDLEQLLSPTQWQSIGGNDGGGDLTMAESPLITGRGDQDVFDTFEWPAAAVTEGDDENLFDFLGSLQPAEEASFYDDSGVAEALESLGALGADVLQNDLETEEPLTVMTPGAFVRTVRPPKRKLEGGGAATVYAVPLKVETEAADPVATVTAIAMPVANTDVAPKKRSRSTVSSSAPTGARGGSGPQRTVPWRKPGTAENARMRAAVWVYRFAPAVRSNMVQKGFGVSVKSLMRYVYDSCQPEFASYGLYFGPAGSGPAGLADRALQRSEGRVSARSTGYQVDPNAPGVPELARRFLVEQWAGGKKR